jgi:integrase
MVFIPHKIAERLKQYIREKGIMPNDRIFSITYPAPRMVVKKAGKLIEIDLNPHDLRRHAATYASRSGTPLEIISKIILRHSNLSTTQRYLGKVKLPALPRGASVAKPSGTTPKPPGFTLRASAFVITSAGQDAAVA